MLLSPLLGDFIFNSLHFTVRYEEVIIDRFKITIVKPIGLAENNHSKVVWFKCMVCLSPKNKNISQCDHLVYFP